MNEYGERWKSMMDEAIEAEISRMVVEDPRFDASIACVEARQQKSNFGASSVVRFRRLGDGRG